MSVRNSEYELVPGDRYMTPSWCTEELLSVEKFPHAVWEPASGNGHMFDVIRRKTGGGIETDISTGYDFLAFTEIAYPCSSIITNPPYSHGLAAKFVRHALELTEPVVGKVAMLLPLAWDSAKTRQDLFKDHPAFLGKYVLTRRIRWLNIDQKSNGPSANHQWLIWDWSKEPDDQPFVGYLPAHTEQAGA